jgi:hypothetical protein
MTTTIADECAWAEEEFGRAALGNQSRTKRAVAMAARMARTPGPTISTVFTDAAEREGAYRFVENDAVDVEAIAASVHDATARRCTGARVMVPVDQSSLLITDLADAKGLGAVGTSRGHGKGIQILTAMAVDEDGTSLGMVGQTYWRRPRAKKRSVVERRRLPVGEKETRYVLDVLDSTRERLERLAPSTVPWYQLDRGYDGWAIHEWIVEHRALATVRATWDRRLWDGDERAEDCLWKRLSSCEPLGDYLLNVPARPGRKARCARVELRACRVTLALRDHAGKRDMRVTVNVVMAREAEAPRGGSERIEWVLYTTHPVEGVEDAYAVVAAYGLRWRVEDFHRAWKSGVCRVEETQLRDFDHIVRWAVLQAAVAMRIERLKHLQRNQPHAPATAELTRDEIDAIITAHRPRGWRVGDTPTMGDAVNWLAFLGGYTGKSSGGPPGSTVIRRGLERIALLARELGRQRREREK